MAPVDDRRSKETALNSLNTALSTNTPRDTVSTYRQDPSTVDSFDLIMVITSPISHFPSCSGLTSSVPGHPNPSIPALNISPILSHRANFEEPLCVILRAQPSSTEHSALLIWLCRRSIPQSRYSSLEHFGRSLQRLHLNPYGESKGVNIYDQTVRQTTPGIGHISHPLTSCRLRRKNRSTPSPKHNRAAESTRLSEYGSTDKRANHASTHLEVDSQFLNLRTPQSPSLAVASSVLHLNSCSGPKGVEIDDQVVNLASVVSRAEPKLIWMAVVTEFVLLEHPTKYHLLPGHHSTVFAGCCFLDSGFDLQDLSPHLFHIMWLDVHPDSGSTTYTLLCTQIQDHLHSATFLYDPGQPSGIFGSGSTRSTQQLITADPTS
ncbi:uncharacterized protein PG986_010736 [Apiospora aurea]|uniref:Uncharacterized protein n=1 Tax=Apiospora aurea TaxID=335848 RepID=A0ABR1Q352_9PEZI